MSGDLTQIINTMTQVVLFAVPVAMVLLLFFWNMSQLIFQSGNAEKIKDARARIFWSIVGMFVLFSLAGLLVLLQNTFFGTSNQNQGAVHTNTTVQNPFGGGNNNPSGGQNNTNPPPSGTAPPNPFPTI